MSVASGSVAPDLLGTRLRISDPKPNHCAACFRGADASVTFVDFDAAIDRGTFVNEQNAVLEGIDDLHLCEACVRAAAEVLALKPALHARQIREIKRLEAENEHWREYAKDLEASIGERPEPARVVGRRLKTTGPQASG